MTRALSTKHARLFPRALVFAALACLSLGAGAGVENPKDTAAVRAVKLDMDLVQRIGAATREFQKLPPSAYPSRTEDSGGMARHGEPVDTMVSQINASPEAKAILASHRLGAREYGLGIYAILNCTMLAATTPAGTTPDAAALERASVTPANARFCQANLAELVKVMKP